MTIQKVALNEVAKVLAILPTSVLADVLNCWVGVWDDPESFGHTEFQAEIVAKLFDDVCKLRPEAVEAALEA